MPGLARPRTRPARDTGPTEALSPRPRSAAGPRAGARSAPGPTCSIVPTSVRTMCRRNESAVTVKWRWSPWRSHAASRMIRTNTSCWLSAGVKAVNSCSPGSSAAQAWRRSQVDGPRPPERALRLERRARHAVEDDVAVGARRGREPRVEPVRSVLCGEHRDVGRQRRVERLRRLRGRRAARHLDARDLPGRVHARVGASCDGEPVPAVRVDRVERLAEHALDRSLAGLPRPAVERATVVLERQLQEATAGGSTTRSRSPCRRHVEDEAVHRADDDRSAGLDRLRPSARPRSRRRP